MVLDLLAEVLSSNTVAGAITFATASTLTLTMINKRRERRERRAAEVKMLLDAHRNLWRGLRQMETYATELRNRYPQDGHALLADDFKWLRDTLRNEALMLSDEIHEEYWEFLKKELKPAYFGFGDHIPAGSYMSGTPASDTYIADLSKMQRIAESQWKKYEAEYIRLGGKYPHAG